MPVSYDFEDGVLLIVCAGEYTPRELKDTWGRAMSDPAFRAGMELCLDVRESTALQDRSVAELKGITRWFGHQSAQVNHRCALLANPGLQYGLMRMTGAWADFRGTEARVFTDRDEALAWLAGSATAESLAR